ncbi:hypothetical protein MKY41_10190 [Sporosarcina sp. FSL W7-1349]|uniref:hypothetical protein n=1 Tax=Sporosarcina sp. FSL W7-1349 TaxID=2921561 RepID=UPI0030FC3AC4
MLLKDHAYDTYRRSFKKFTSAFIQVFTSEDALDDLSCPEEEKLEVITKNMNGSQSRFLDALRYSLSDETWLIDLTYELYSKQPDARSTPVYYLSIQHNYENRTVLLGENFFKPSEELSAKSLLENVQAMEDLIDVLAKFKAAAANAINMEEFDHLLEEYYENQEEKDEEQMNVRNESALFGEKLAEENSYEQEIEQDVEESSEVELELDDVFDEEDDEMEPSNYERLTEEDLIESDFDWDGVFEDEEVETESPLEQLNELIIELYKYSDLENRSLIKQLRGELFELEVASESGEDFAEMVLQFQRQLLSLQLHAVEDLQIQIQMARYSLELLAGEQEE